MTQAQGEDQTAAALRFGEALERLEAIVARLESDDALGLEEALALYEEGVAIAGECRRRLAAAQLRLTQLQVAPVMPDEPVPASEGPAQEPPPHRAATHDEPAPDSPG
jgi:exodeoxyribonuclease VII small subunit